MPKKLSTVEFINKAKLLHDNKYDYSLVEYINQVGNVKIICSKHGIFEQRAKSHLRGMGCNKCRADAVGDRSRKTHDQFIADCNRIHGDLFDYSKTIYTADNAPVVITCKKHGDFTQEASSHLRGRGCPKCKASSGEKKVRDYLIDNGYSFEEQYRFNDCTGLYNKTLPFDFYIKDRNIAIEFDGQQHFNYNDYFGGVDAYERRVINDQIKNDYCWYNSIKLIRIAHFDDVDIKLNEFFSFI